MKNFFFPILALSAVLTSCELNSNDPQLSRADDAIRIRPVETKIDATADGAFVAGDNIGLYMTETSKSTVMIDGAQNNKYTLKATTFEGSTTEDIVKYPGQVEYNFYAYYPFKGTSKTHAPITLSVVGQNGATNKDLFALRSESLQQLKSKGSELSMSFKRLTSKIVFNIKPGVGVSDLSTMSKVELRGFTSAGTLDVLAGTFTGTTKDNFSATLTGATGSATGMIYILPTAAAVNKGDLKFVFFREGIEYPMELNTGEDFAAGKVYTYTITISTTEVTGKPTIDSWPTSIDRTGNAER